MDFQTLNRRELQALCKLNKIRANITNIAMVDALKSLDTVEGIEEFLNPSRTKTVGLSIESPERIVVTSPRVPRTSSRICTCTRKKAKIECNEFLKTPLVSCTRKKDPETSYCQGVASQVKEGEDIAKNESLVDHEKNRILYTPVVGATYSQMKVTKSTRKKTVKQETTTVQGAYSTRRSTRLAAKKSQGTGLTSVEDLGKPLQEKHNVVVLNNNDDNSKIEKVVHVDTPTLESGEENVDCCGDVDNLRVKLDKIFEQLDDVHLDGRQNGGEKFDNFEENRGQVDNLKSDSEGIFNPSEPSKLDNHSVAEAINGEGIEENFSGNTIDFVNPKKQKASMELEDRGGEPQESLNEVERIEELLNSPRPETDELSIELPEKTEVTSPGVLCTSSRTGARKKARIEVNEVLETPLVSSIRKKDVANQANNSEDIAKNESLVNYEKNCIPDTPVVAATISQRNEAKSTPTRKGTVKKDTTTVKEFEERGEPVDVTSEEDLGKCIQEKHDAVLDESDEISKMEKVVHVDTTTVESGKEKVEFYGVVDNLKAQIFEQLSNVDLEEREKFVMNEVDNPENKSDQVDSQKPDSEDICNPFVDGEKIDLNEDDDIDANVLSFDTENPSEPSKLDNLDNHYIAEVVTADGIEENTSGNKVDFGEAQGSSMAETAFDLNSVQVNQEGDGDEVTRESVADVSFVEGNQLSANAKNDVIDQSTSVRGMTGVSDNKDVSVSHISTEENSERKMEVVASEENRNNNEKEAVVDEKHKSLSDNSSLRQLKKKLKATLLNSPTSMRIKNEVSDKKDNSDIEKPQVVVAEENEKEVVGDEKAKSLTDNNSLRQLKKQLKATLFNSPTSIRIKNEVSDNKANSDIKEPQVVAEENEKEAVGDENAKSLLKNNSLRQLKKQLKTVSVKYNMDANKDDKVATREMEN